MKKKAAVLPPPVILNPKNGEVIEDIEISGTGVATSVIFIQSNIFAGWRQVANVATNGTWKAHIPQHDFELPGNVWIDAMQEHWDLGESEPSQRVSYTKLLERPIITKPLAGESLHWLNQVIQGTVRLVAPAKVEIELTTVPPARTYKSEISTSGAGQWTARPSWPLDPGTYLLKCRRIYREVTSRWSDDIPVVVGAAPKTD